MAWSKGNAATQWGGTVADAAQISPDDLFITFFETAGENISFGRGLAQRADNSKLYSGS